MCVCVQVKGVPFLLANNDATFENGLFAHWPPFPWFVRLVIRFWFFPKKKQLWRFGSATASGQPKELPFADKKTA